MKTNNSQNWYDSLPREGGKSKSEFDLKTFYKLADEVREIFEEEEERLEQEQRKNQASYPTKLL